MVNLIIKQKKKHKNTITLLKCAFEEVSCDGNDVFMIITQEYAPSFREHKYHVKGDWIIKVADDKIFIMSDYIVSVIDLTNEAPYQVENVRSQLC